MINLYQIPSKPETRDVKCDLMFYGFASWTDELAKHYVHVASFDVDTVNEAFEIGNIGPEEKIMRNVKERMHSPSIGDVFVNTMTGQASFINRIGFVFLAPGLFPVVA